MATLTTSFMQPTTPPTGTSTVSTPEEVRLASLLAGVVARNETDLATLYDTTCRCVFGLVARLLDDHQDAEEVTMDVYVQVWDQAQRYSPARGRPLAWLLMIARSRALDRLRSGARRRRHQRSLEESAVVETAAEDAATVTLEQGEQLGGVLAGLPDVQRQVLELAYLEGLTQAQVAERLGEPLGTVKTRMRRGMARLREAAARATVAPPESSR